ncbi:type II secretion system F family protein [Methanolobus zinderi]|jgi:flagellar protein FlaJ|uniref:Type II secretion system F family protein n=1 Tax=Methanolobus zinderi TaxID=536044 RepID=A0A7D5E7A5_9EURY|nr:type II secretion system F family protein [Methanolobus zinderi]KXS44258.1 MAG: type II secretion system protein [Methanolobus sp. T82-4]QLC49558.1 type II secretion system F family protein [Methanolobus zinderi]
MKFKELFKKDLHPAEVSLTEEELCALEDSMVARKMEDSKKFVVFKEFLKSPGKTLFRNPEYTFILSVPVALLVFVFGMSMTWGTPLIDDVIVFTALIIITPPAIAYQKKYSNTDKIEEYLPTFLRDISEMSRAGLTLPRSVNTVSKGEYGALTTEVRKMDLSMSWGISFEQTLQNFANRVPTPIILRSVSLINQASRAGGRVSSVLEAAARDAREVKLLEQERRGNMMVYVVIIYMSFFVFLFVIAMLTSTFVPTMAEAGRAASAAGAGNQFIGAFDPAKYTRLMLHTAVIQGFMSGLVAGQMGEGAVSRGLKHSIIMTMIAWIVFTFLI